MPGSRFGQLYRPAGAEGDTDILSRAIGGPVPGALYGEFPALDIRESLESWPTRDVETHAGRADSRRLRTFVIYGAPAPPYQIEMVSRIAEPDLVGDLPAFAQAAVVARGCDVVDDVRRQARASWPARVRGEEVQQVPGLFGRNAVDVAMATAAAPTYLPGMSLDGARLVDGGVWANNPAMVAWP